MLKSLGASLGSGEATKGKDARAQHDQTCALK